MNKLPKKVKKPVQLNDAEWGRLSQRICRIIEKVMNEHKLIMNPSLDDLICVNSWARVKTLEIIKGDK